MEAQGRVGSFQLRSRFATRLNRDWHRTGLLLFLVLVAAHLAEHVVQAAQVFVLGMPRPEARGLLGMAAPALVESEALHFGYAFATLLGLILLQPGFAGAARRWWNAALAIGAWHVMEHGILLAQAVGQFTLLGAPTSTSVAQLVVPRVELHLFYNLATALPLLIGAALHRWPGSDPTLRPAPCACPAARS